MGSDKRSRIIINFKDFFKSENDDLVKHLLFIHKVRVNKKIPVFVQGLNIFISDQIS